MNREQISQLSFDCVLPAAIFFNETLEPNCIKLYAMVRNLSKAHGYCFATNDYLAELLNVDASSIKRWLVSLKEAGYLKIEPDRKGIHWQRRLYLSDKFKKSLRRFKNKLPPAQNCAPPSSKMSHIKEEYIKEEIVEQKPPIAPLKKWGAYVEMREEQFEKLVNCYGPKIVLDLFEAINDYITNHRNGKGYKDYTAAFRTFYKNYESRKEKSSWQKTKYPNKSSDYKNTSSAKDMPEPVLVPLSSLMDTRDCFSPG